jgi:hypothetical protein
MKRDSGNTHEKKTRICWPLGALPVAMLAAATLVFVPALLGETQAETVSYCQLLKAPSAFDGKVIRITGVYLYSFETQRLLPSSCCEDRDMKTWVEFGKLDGKSRKLVRRFPKGTGMVLGTFVGRLDYGEYQGSQFKFTITAVESVDRMAKGSEIKKAAWAPPFCKQ